MRSEVQIFPDPPLYGAIAQLGERLLCTQEVGGSIPPGSTTFHGDLLHEHESSNERKAFPLKILLFNNLDISDVLNGSVTRDFSRLASNQQCQARKRLVTDSIKLSHLHMSH